ncbi:FRG domain-containing protein, partial [Nocardioides sp. cx-173]
IAEAARRNVTGIGGLAGLSGFGSPAITNAVDNALADAAKRAVLSPNVTSAIAEAARRNVTGIGGLAGLSGFGSPAITNAVDNALADAAKRAVLSPEVSSTVSAAARRQANWAGALGPDPALRIALQRERVKPEIAVEPTAPTAPDAPDAHRAIPSEGTFSPEYSGPGSFFGAHEVVIESFAGLTSEVQALAAKNHDLRFVWRGQQDANWGLHSSLYRRLMAHRLVVDSPSPGEDSSIQRFPDEEAMLAAELGVLDEAVEWRMSETSALELFARLQHHGGPTRLLDVTRNPLIATWFAVEAGIADASDARLFALATGPVTEGAESPAGQPVISEVLAGSRYPFWTYGSAEERAAADWGTGSRRRIWIPPAYDARIAAQNAAFLLEGVPMLTRETLLFRSGTNGRHWSAVDVAASMSIYARPTHPHSRPRATNARLAPLFSFRITAKAKAEIREMLDRTYGYTAALLYPDIQGMSNRLRTRSDWLDPPTSLVADIDG